MQGYYAVSEIGLSVPGEGEVPGEGGPADGEGPPDREGAVPEESEPPGEPEPSGEPEPAGGPMLEAGLVSLGSRSDGSSPTITPPPWPQARYRHARLSMVETRLRTPIR